MFRLILIKGHISLPYSIYTRTVVIRSSGLERAKIDERKTPNTVGTI